jgi:hypothetical protein
MRYAIEEVFVVRNGAKDKQPPRPQIPVQLTRHGPSDRRREFEKDFGKVKQIAAKLVCTDCGAQMDATLASLYIL